MSSTASWGGGGELQREGERERAITVSRYGRVFNFRVVRFATEENFIANANDLL